LAEKASIEYANKWFNPNVVDKIWDAAKENFKNGYKAKQSEKKYNEILKNLVENIELHFGIEGVKNNKCYKEAVNYLQSLSTTKEPINFEVAVEQDNPSIQNILADDGKLQPKVINRVLQGVWKFK